MADRKVDLGTKVVSAVAAMAAAFVARKVITFVWTKATGKEPPTQPGGSAGGPDRGAQLVRADRRQRRGGEAARHPGCGT